MEGDFLHNMWLLFFDTYIGIFILVQKLYFAQLPPPIVCLKDKIWKAETFSEIIRQQQQFQINVWPSGSGGRYKKII